MSEPEVYQAQAALSRLLARHAEEERALRGLVSLSADQWNRVDEATLVSAHKRLSSLYADDGPLPDRVRHAECQLNLGRLSRDATSALARYRTVVIGWPWEQAVAEVERVIAKSPQGTAVACGLLCAWASQGEEDLAGRRREVAAYLASAGARLAGNASVSEIRLYCAKLGLEVLAIDPALCSRFAEVLLQAMAMPQDRDVAVRLALSAAAASIPLPSQVPLKLRQLLFADGAADATVDLLREYVDDDRIKHTLAALARGSDSQGFALNVSRLVDVASDASAAVGWDILLAAREVVPSATRTYAESQARLAHRLGRYVDEAEAWWEIVTLATSGDSTAHEKRLVGALEQLRALYRPGGPLPDPTKLDDCQLRQARLSQDPATAFDLYARAVAGWEWSRLMAELDRSRVQRQPMVAAALFCAWISDAPADDTQERVDQVLTYLEVAGWQLLVRASHTEARTYVASLGVPPLCERPKLASRLSELLLSSGENSDDSVRLALAALAGGQQLAVANLETIIGLLTGGRDPSAVAALLAPYRVDGCEGQLAAIFVALCKALKPQPPDAMRRWLALFPPASHLATGLAGGLQLLVALGEARRNHPDAKLLDFLPAESVVDELDAMADKLLGDVGYAEDAHKCWVAVCWGRSALFAKHFERCLALQPPETEWAKEAFGHILAIGSSRYITAFFRRVSSDETLHKRLPERILRAGRFHRMLRRYLRASPGRSLPDFSNAGLEALWQAMDVESDVHNADMYVATIRAISKRRGARSMAQYTDLVAEARALCAARRYSEAEDTAWRPDVVNGGREGAGLLGEIARKRLRPERTGGDGDNDSDCQLILKACFLDAKGRT